MITSQQFNYRPDGRVTLKAMDDSGASFSTTEYSDAACVAKMKAWEEGLKTKAHSYPEYRALVDDEQQFQRTEQGI